MVIGVGRHSETLEELVVYRALYGNRDLWVRPAGERDANRAMAVAGLPAVAEQTLRAEISEAREVAGRGSGKRPCIYIWQQALTIGVIIHCKIIDDFLSGLPCKLGDFKL